MKSAFKSFLKSFGVLSFLLISQFVIGQTVNPAKWSWELVPKNPQVGDFVEIVFKVKIEDDWYLYSSDFDPELGPVVTTVNFEKDPSFSLNGQLKAIKPSSKYDEEIWGGTYTYFKHEAHFRQKIKILSKDLKIKGSYDSQSCSNVTGLCVPVRGNFEIVKELKEVNSEEGIGKSEDLGGVNSEEGIGKSEDLAGVKSEEGIGNSEEGKVKSEDLSGVNSEEGEESLFMFFFIALGAGFLALLTPCVYPLIPMTVSFFTKQSGGKSLAFIYGGFIVLIYVFFGTLMAFFAGASFANFLSTHWIPNMLFFVIFILFGISFLGAFEIVLPSNFVNKVDAKSDRGGLIGVFFMAFTLVLVSFSCTGPLAGSILIAASQGAFLKPIIGMLGFSLAFAIPFTLFAIFPNFLNSIPKSGGWMNEVKVVLGFLEIALAFKFLSVADQVYHWGILDREVYLAIWIAVFIAITLYLFGKIRMPHDGAAKNLTVTKVLLGLISLTFVIYMIPGMFGAPLKGLSGWLPPIDSQDFRIGAGNSSVSTESKRNVKYGDFLKLPYGIEGFFDYNEAKAYAEKVGKPMFIDFTGHGCVNCRKMEEYVWSDSRVLDILKNDFVVLALYSDDKTELPENEWYVSKVDGQVKKTIGDQNLDFQIDRFNANAQPHYVLLDPRHELDGPMEKPVAFDTNIESFILFLEKGKKKYQSN